MNTSTKRVLFWTPRVLGILFAMFSNLFALYVFSEECQNPIVELKNLEIGDFKTAADDIKEMNKQFKILQ